MIRRFLILLVWTSAAFGLGWLGLRVAPASYRSDAIVRLAPSSVPDLFIPGGRRLSPGITFADFANSLLTRALCLNIVNSFGLYPGDRARQRPAEDLAQQLLQDVEIKPFRQRAVQISFRYGDAVLAQRVTQHIATRVIDESAACEAQRITSSIRFLADELEVAAADWKGRLAALQTARSVQLERVKLDVDLTRNRYVALKEKLETEKLVQSLYRPMGPAVELLDPASLPTGPERNESLMLCLATLAGLIGGLLHAGWLRMPLFPKQL